MSNAALLIDASVGYVLPACHEHHKNGFMRAVCPSVYSIVVYSYFKTTCVYIIDALYMNIYTHCMNIRTFAAHILYQYYNLTQLDVDKNSP